MKRTAWLALALALAADAAALDAGTLTLRLHARDGTSVAIGRVVFTPRADGRFAFVLSLDHGPFVDHFLSMREFKCLPGRGEVLCHVPYPYPNPSQVAAGDLAWLEHALLFLVKKPGEFGANLGNGVYWQLREDGRGIVGRPQAVDLNLIGTPPPRPEVPPYKPALRDDIPVGARWFERLTID